MQTVSIDWRGFKLYFHTATVYYLGGVDPKLQWRVRGVSGHDSNLELRDTLKAQKDQAFNNLMTTKEGKIKTREFALECIKLMDGFMSKGSEFITNYLGKREYKFILGAMRTGGTYTYKGVCEIHGQEWDSMALEMVHDSIPEYQFLSEYFKPNIYFRLLFDMAQFLVWVKREVDSPIVIQKRIAYAHALPFLNAMFGRDAEYIVTVRHPVPLAYSFAKVLKTDPFDSSFKEPPLWARYVMSSGFRMSEEEWGALSYFQKVLYYWSCYYSDVSNSIGFSDQVKLVGFGKGLSDFLETEAKQAGVEQKFDAFNCQEKTPNNEVDEYECNKIISSVKARCELNGLIFPEITFS